MRWSWVRQRQSPWAQGVRREDPQQMGASTSPASPVPGPAQPSQPPFIKHDR